MRELALFQLLMVRQLVQEHATHLPQLSGPASL